MQRFAFFIFCTCSIFIGCKESEKKAFKPGEKINVSDFVSYFDAVKLPTVYKDSLMMKTPSDSVEIDHDIFKQIIPDTVFKADFGKAVPTLYAIGEFKNSDIETYLLMSAYGADKKILYVAVLDEKNKFTTMQPLVTLSDRPGRQEVGIDKKFTFNIITDTKGSDGQTYAVTKSIAYNNTGIFNTLLIDGLPAGVQMPIINPIDTFPKKGKWAGDYYKDSRNLISIRDGEKPNQLRFYIHVEKKEPTHGEGELKASGIWMGADTSYYKADGDPCGMGFKFKGNNLTILEQNCGNRHDQVCSFDGVYTKWKDGQKPKDPTPPKAVTPAATDKRIAPVVKDKKPTSVAPVVPTSTTEKPAEVKKEAPKTDSAH